MGTHEKPTGVRETRPRTNKDVVDRSTDEGLCKCGSPFHAVAIFEDGRGRFYWCHRCDTNQRNK